MKRWKQVENKGYSLLELIIVVVIASVMLGVGILGISLLSSRPVDECARKLQVAIENNRTTTMGKLTASLDIYVGTGADDGYIMIEEFINNDGSTPGKVSRVGEKSVKVYYKYQGDPDLHELPADPGINISFNRGSGALNPQPGLPTVKYIEKLVIKRGDKQMEVSIDKLTGRVTIN